MVAGTTLGMMIADVPAVLPGEVAANGIPLKLVNRLAAAAFVVLGLLVGARRPRVTSCADRSLKALRAGGAPDTRSRRVGSCRARKRMLASDVPDAGTHHRRTFGGVPCEVSLLAQRQPVVLAWPWWSGTWWAWSSCAFPDRLPVGL